MVASAITVAGHGRHFPHLEDSRAPPNSSADGDCSPEDSPLQERIFERQYFSVKGILTCGRSDEPVEPVNGARVEVWDHNSCGFPYSRPPVLVRFPMILLLGLPDDHIATTYSDKDGHYSLYTYIDTSKGINFDPYIYIAHVCNGDIGCSRLRYTHYFNRGGHDASRFTV